MLDPACGSGHMLTYAFDLIYAIYEEEGYTPSSIPALILTHNLRGLEVDDRAAQLASFALAMKARGRDRRFLQRRIQPDIIWIRPIMFETTSVQRIVQTVTTQPRANGSPADAEAVTRLLYAFVEADYFGSLIRVNAAALAALDDALDALEVNAADLYASNDAIQARDLVRQAKALVDQQYHVVIANPPYLAARNMALKLKKWVERNYAGAKNDLLAAFMVRATEVCVQSGQWGMIVLPSWLFLSTFAAFREWFLHSQRIESLLHLGRGIFGSDFGSDAFSVTNAPAPAGYRATYRRLFDQHVQVRKPEVIENLFRDPDYHRFETKQSDFKLIPESPIAYWLSDAMKATFLEGESLAEITALRQGLATADNDRFLRRWFEVQNEKTGFSVASCDEAKESGKKWFPYNKGGEFRRWWGNQEYVVNWERDGREIRGFVDSAGKQRSRPQNSAFYFKSSVSWSDVSSGVSHFRRYPGGFIFDVKGMSAFPEQVAAGSILGLLNSSVCPQFLLFLSPTINAQIGDVGKIPVIPADRNQVVPLVDELVLIFRSDWDFFETSWDFEVNPLVALGAGALEAHAKTRWDNAVATSKRAQELEEGNNQYFARLYGLEDEVECMVPLSRVSLMQNPYFRYAPTKGAERSEEDYRTLFFRDLAKELVSYAVGCMMGRYSLDAPGLILANRGATLQDYLARVPSPTFTPDGDNVLPIVEGDWFEDDIVARFRQFVRATFGEHHFEENLRFVTESLGVKDLRDYFVKSFYKDHVQRYKKRPIYWLFSSPKGSFNALIYMHRYTPSTVSMVLNEYLREFKAKLQSSLQQQERFVAAGGGTPRQQAAAQKEADRLRKVLLELDEYEHDVLYPLASQQISIDLDDGVKVNYLKFGAALKKIPGLEASE